MGEREQILWVCFVEVGEVDVHPILPVLLSYYHDIGEPIGIFHLDQRTDVDELLDFFINDLFHRGVWGGRVQL